MRNLAEHLVECWERGKVEPYVLELRVSNECNLNCIFCPGYDKSVDQKKSLSTAEWKSVIRQASAVGIKQCIFFSDLEPLMYKDALELMLEIKKQNLVGKTATNGTLLTKEVCKKLVKAGWDEINVSLEGPDQETNDAIRGKGVFAIVTKNLLDLKEIKETLKNDKPKVMFHTVLTNRVYKKLDKLIILAHNLGIDSVNFHPLSLWNKETKNLELTQKQCQDMVKYIKQAKETSKKLGINTNIESFIKRKWEKDSIKIKKDDNPNQKEPKPLFLNTSCFLPMYFISVHKDGRVNPCHTLHEPDENVKNKNLKSIWDGPYFSAIRKKIEKKNFPKQCYTDCCMMQSATHLKLKEEILDVLTKKNALKKWMKGQR